MSTLGTALLESRMAGNARDRNLAFQAAEIGLRDAELFIRDSRRLDDGINYSPQLLNHDNDAYLDLNETVQACTYGVCNNGGEWVTTGKDWITNPVWENNAFWANAIQYQRDVATVGKPVGRAAGGIQLAFNAAYVLPTAGLPLVSRQPEYLIEGFSNKIALLHDTHNYYRITVRGYGMRPGTRVMLQEVYTPN